MTTLQIEKQEWLNKFSTQQIAGQNFMAHPVTVYKNGNGLPFFTYKYFDDFGDVNHSPTGSVQVDIIVTDWLDFNVDAFKEELKLDHQKRINLFTNK